MKPTRSANSTDTSRRSACGVPRAPSSRPPRARPHSPQNFAPGAFGLPHTTDRQADPTSPQNFRPTSFSSQPPLTPHPHYPSSRASNLSGREREAHDRDRRGGVLRNDRRDQPPARITRVRRPHPARRAGRAADRRRRVLDDLRQPHVERAGGADERVRGRSRRLPPLRPGERPVADRRLLRPAQNVRRVPRDATRRGATRVRSPAGPGRRRRRRDRRGGRGGEADARGRTRAGRRPGRARDRQLPAGRPAGRGRRDLREPSLCPRSVVARRARAGPSGGRAPARNRPDDVRRRARPPRPRPPWPHLRGVAPRAPAAAPPRLGGAAAASRRTLRPRRRGPTPRSACSALFGARCETRQPTPSTGARSSRRSAAIPRRSGSGSTSTSAAGFSSGCARTGRRTATDRHPRPHSPSSR